MPSSRARRRAALPFVRSALLAVAAGVMVVACDLPTTPLQARQRLARGEVRTATYELPVPRRQFNLRDELAKGDAAGGVIDTTNLSLTINPDPIRLALGDFMSFDSVNLDPVQIGYTPDLADYDMTADVAAPELPVSFTAQGMSVPLVPSSAGSTPALPVDFSSEFASATFGAGSRLTIQLTTDAVSSLTGVTVRLTDTAGSPLASSSTPTDVAPSGSTTIEVPIGGLTLPSALRVILDFSAATGDGSSGNLAVTVGFASATVTAATGVPASRITPVTFTRNVALDAANATFSEAVIASGTVSLTQFAFGGLTFTPDANFETNLAGKHVGGSSPDSLQVGGTLGPAAGATTVDVATAGTVGVRLSNFSISSVTMRQVDFTPVQTVNVLDPASTQFAGVDSVRIRSGAVVVNLANRLRLGGQVTVRLNGATNSLGQPLQQVVNIAASPDESPVTTTITLDLSGATIHPSQLVAQATGSFHATNVTITDTAAARAVTVDPRLTALTAASVSINGASTYTFAVDQSETFTIADLGLEDVRDYLKNVSLNGVSITLVMHNPAAASVAVDSLGLTLVNGSGVPVLDGSGNPIRAALQNSPGRLTMNAGSTDSVTVPASALVNGLIQEIVAGRTAGFRARGTAHFAGSGGTLAASDTVAFTVHVRTPLDLTLPSGGITVSKLTLNSVDSLDKDGRRTVQQLSQDLSSAGAKLELTNGSPFGLTVSVAFVPMSLVPTDTTGYNAFNAATKFAITNIVIPAATVKADGTVATPAVATVDVAIPVKDLPVLTQGKLAMAYRLTLNGPGSGRAHLTTSDFLTVGGTLHLQITTAASAGSH